jgi:alpha-galactosidase
MNINFQYYKEGKKIKLNFDNDYNNEDFTTDVTVETSNNINKLELIIIPHRQIEIDKLAISVDYMFRDNNRIFVNGYQSWTDSREFFIDEKIKSISKLAAPIMKKYQFHKYGDYTFKKYSQKNGEFHGYTYSYIREGNEIDLIGSLSERNGFTIIEQYVKQNKIVINKECKGLNINDKYIAFELVWIKGNEEDVFDKYFELMGIEKNCNKPMSGWTSWYNYYQNINERIILKNLESFKALNKNIDIFQIDDGYQYNVGDWLLVDKEKFPNGMKYIADSIKKKGYKAGIWLAPFVCETNSMIYKDKKEWILKDEKGELVLAGSNWSRFYALDIYNPQVREYIKKVFSIILNDWGYDMVKLDFLYAVCLIPTKIKTRGQIMTEAMEFLRQCVGDKLILGCGVPLGTAFGLVDYCRIGCDVGLDWDDKFYMKALHRERISTLNAIRNAIGRRHLNGRAFLNDPDVFLLREDNISLTDTQKHTLSLVNSIFGNLIFTSDNIDSYGEKEHYIFNNIIKLQDKNIEKIETYRNNLIEITYNQDGKKYMVLINLSNNIINYNNLLYKLEEKFIDDNKTIIINDNKLELQPYESRIFLVK